MLDELRRVALFGSGVAELTRNRAEQIVKDLIARGDIGRGDAGTVVKDLIERSKENRKELTALVRGELQDQIGRLGVATSRDLERLERRVTRLEERVKQLRTEAAAKPAAKKTATAPQAKPKPGPTPADAT